jgi:hypothetical protein
VLNFILNDVITMMVLIISGVLAALIVSRTARTLLIFGLFALIVWGLAQ